MAGLADGLAATGVLVVGCDVADAGVQAGGVVLGAHSVELGSQDGGIGDGQQVRPFVLERAVEGLDPRLVARSGSGWARVLGDGDHGHELLGCVVFLGLGEFFFP